MTIGEKIFQLRKQNGYSQEELADKLNVSRQSVSLWETNQTVPQINYLIELSIIFNVTLDELCNNNILNKKEENEQNEDPILVTNFEFNENKVNQVIRMLQRRPRITLLISINIIFIGIMILAKQVIGSLVFFDILVNIGIITFYIKSNKSSKKLLLDEKKTIQISFYQNHFFIFSKSEKNEVKNTVLYDEITKLYFNDEIIIIVFNNKYIAVDVEALKENEEIILNKLKTNTKKISDQTSINSGRIRTWSIVLFIGCFVSIILAIILYGIAVQNNKYDFAEGTFVLKSWVFYIAAIIPIISFVFGLIFNRRFKCKKNIIAGSIIGAILCLYGSFCLIFRPFFSFDKEYLINISETTNIEFPEEYLLVSDSLTLGYETYVKFTNEKEIMEFENNIKTSVLWNDVQNLPNDLSLFIINRVSNYDIFYIYELNGEINNDELEVDKLLFTYNFEDNILLIHEIILDTSIEE